MSEKKEPDPHKEWEEMVHRLIPPKGTHWIILNDSEGPRTRLLVYDKDSGAVRYYPKDNHFIEWGFVWYKEPH